MNSSQLQCISSIRSKHPIPIRHAWMRPPVDVSKTTTSWPAAARPAAARLASDASGPGDTAGISSGRKAAVSWLAMFAANQENSQALDMKVGS